MKKGTILAAVVLCAMGGSVRAMDEVYELMPVVVTATRTENQLEKIPAATQVITRSDMERTGARNLRDLLTDMANIFMKYRPRGGGHDVVIRGMDTDKSLILVDGRRIANEADAGGYGNAMALDRINMGSVERIEIVKGASSALYGSEAMGGVVNIITKKSVKPEVRIGLEGTTDDRSNWYHFDTGHHGPWSAEIDMRFHKIPREMEISGEGSNYYGNDRNYAISVNYDKDERNGFQVWANRYSQDLRRESGDGTLKPVTVMMGKMKLTGQVEVAGTGLKDFLQRSYGISWKGKSDDHQWQLQTYKSRFNWDREERQHVVRAIPGKDPMSKRAFPGYIRSRYKDDFHTDTNDLWVVEGRDTFHFSDTNRVTFGGEYIRNTVSGTGLGANGDGVHDLTMGKLKKPSSEKVISTYALYVQDEIDYGQWFIVPAIRYDHHEFYGSHTSPKVGITYNANENLRIKANYGEGFKAPTVNQLFYDLDMNMGSSARPNWVHLTGNANLQPETSRSWDIGFEGKAGRFYGSLVYFDNHVNDLIASVKQGEDEAGHNLYQYQNVNKAHIKGVENVVGYHINDVWEARVVSTWLSAKDTTRNLDLPRRARLSQLYQLMYNDHSATGWQGSLWNQFDYDYVTDGARGGLPGPKRTYSLWNVSVAKHVDENTRVYGSIRNIFDKEDQECDLYGRYWTLGIEHAF